MPIPERPFCFLDETNMNGRRSRDLLSSVRCRGGQKGGKAMEKEPQAWMMLKVWLFSPRLAVWGEGMVESLIFSLIALGMWRVGWE